MLIFDSEAMAAKGRALELAERTATRWKIAIGIAFGICALGIVGGIAAAAFNALVPLFGSFAGVHDTWGRPELIGPQLLVATISFAVMVVGILLIEPLWDKSETRRDQLRDEESRLERFATAEAAEMSFECKSKRHRDFSEYPYGHCRHC